MRFLMFLLLTTSAFAKIETKDGYVQPATYTNVPLKQLVKDYAELMNMNVTYPKNTIKDKDLVYLKLNNQVTKDDFRKIFYNLLETYGLTVLEHSGSYWLIESRDIRYGSSPIKTGTSYPKDSSYIMYLLKLKYPLSNSISRNLRPFLSRYGRVIDLSDARTLIIQDTGDNVEKILKTISFMDTEAGYQRMLNFTPKKEENENHPLKEKVIELETEKKILEKKYMDLKMETGK